MKENMKKADKSVEQLRQFRMHPDLLFSVIKAQAGTHEKALLEAVMNAVDAGATECVLEVDEKGYIIKDNGKGFSSKQEIEDFFETFGTPHKEGDATYGKFRMGRGQLFAFSHTIWNSNEFMMDVCIKTRGLDYILKEGQPIYNGCQIKGKWHTKLKNAEVLNLVREMKLLVKFMQIPVTLNGEVISSLAENQKWDATTPEAYIKTSKTAGTLSVYNLGALVCHYPASKFGIGGIVVAKEQLTVNFARNDVLVSECKVWKKITKKLNELMGIEVEKKTALTDSERIAMVNNILSGKTPMSKYLNKGLLTDVCSKKPTFNNLFKAVRISISTGSYQTRIVEEKIHTQEMAFVLDHSMLERFNVNNPEEFVKKINELVQMNNAYVKDLCKDVGYRSYQIMKQEGVSHLSEFNPTFVPIETLLKSMNNSYEFKKATTMDKKEKCALSALQDVADGVTRLVEMYLYRQNPGSSWNERKKIEPRTISIGISQVADAWTDGFTYIAISDRMFKSVDPYNLLFLVLHEYCHNESTNETHSHPIEFMEMFHDILRYQSFSFGVLVNKYSERLIRAYTKAGIKGGGGLENELEKMNQILDIPQDFKELQAA
jgi:hypothetical protein